MSKLSKYVTNIVNPHQWAFAYTCGTMKPIVSFLIPFYNPGNRIFDCIESVLSQEGPEFEVVLVDNGSDDGTYDLVASRYRIHHRIRLAHEPQMGIAHALNTGLKWCSGKYIARMDADDICLPGRMEKQVAHLESNPNVGLVSGLVRHQGDSASEGMAFYVEQINKLIKPDDIRNFRFIDSPFAHPSVMYKKELIDLYGGYNSNGLPEDYELWLRWIEAGVAMEKINEEVLLWNDLTTRLSRNHPNYSREAFETARIPYLQRWLRGNVRPDKPIFIWGGGKFSRQKAKLLEQAGVRIHGFIDVVDKGVVDGKPVIHFSRIPSPASIFILSSVSNRGKYQEIRDHLTSQGHTEGLDFILSS
jgi:glycosyltransferase involved in cell wall biosynthesis